MATLARCEFDATNSATGALLTNVSVEVRLESGGLVQVYADRSGASPLGNPFTAADGHVAFHAAGGAYRVIMTAGSYSRELRYVAIGLAAETDFTLSRPAGAWADDVLYATGDLTYDDGYMFISRVDANLNNEPDTTTPGDTDEWMFAGAALPGEGLRFDAQADDLAGLAAFDGEPERFAVLVSDVGDGRSAIYVMGDGGSGDWSDPAYVTGPVGPPGDMQKADNLAGLANVATARSNLGLGNAATKNVGTAAGTVAAGDDSRFNVKFSMSFGAQRNQPPTANFATLDTRNGHLVMDFDAGTQETAIFSDVVPVTYDGASGFTVDVHWAATSATTGTIGWDVAFEKVDAQDIDSDSFATAKTVTAATVPAAAGTVTKTSVAFVHSEIDGLVAGDAFRLRIRRDVANDTATGDAELLRVVVGQT